MFHLSLECGKIVVLVCKRNGEISMELKEILEEIYNSGLQWKVYTALHSNFIEDYGKMVDECREYKATIDAIRKINAGKASPKGKAEGIKSLCSNE